MLRGSTKWRRGGEPIKKDIHYKGDVGQSIMPNKQLQLLLILRHLFFHHLISVHPSLLHIVHFSSKYPSTYMARVTGQNFFQSSFIWWCVEHDWLILKRRNHSLYHSCNEKIFDATIYLSKSWSLLRSILLFRNMNILKREAVLNKQTLSKYKTLDFEWTIFDLNYTCRFVNK